MEMRFTEILYLPFKNTHHILSFQLSWNLNEKQIVLFSVSLNFILNKKKSYNKKEVL